MKFSRKIRRQLKIRHRNRRQLRLLKYNFVLFSATFVAKSCCKNPLSGIFITPLSNTKLLGKGAKK